MNADNCTVPLQARETSSGLKKQEDDDEVLEQRPGVRYIYVSPLGNDFNQGYNIDKPIRSLQQAVDLAASASYKNSNETCTIVLREGILYIADIYIYVLTSTNLYL